jgi:hypothetical protein
MTERRISLDTEFDVDVHESAGKVRTLGGDYMYSAWGCVYLHSTGELVDKADVYGETAEEAEQSLREELTSKARRWKQRQPP